MFVPFFWEQVVKRFFEKGLEVRPQYSRVRTEVAHTEVRRHPPYTKIKMSQKTNISVLKSPSGRWLYQVMGSSGIHYVVLPNSNVCQCPAFKFAVVKRRDSIMCKHVLAARLAEAMCTFEEKMVSDYYIMDILTCIQ
ncbi:unnamed protein product, partial [Meganyctiphanes norvegica]